MGPRLQRMKMKQHMAGGIATSLVTLLVIAIVGVAVFFAVDSMLGKDGDAPAAEQAESGALTAEDARRIGREEGAKVARDVAYDVALDVAQNSGAAALYGDSFAAADGGSDDYASTDYGSYDSTADAGDSGDAYGDYGDYGSDASDSDGDTDYGSDSYGADDYGSDSYGADPYGTDSSDSASDSGTSDDTSDAYGSDDYASDDYGSDDFASDDYASDDYGSDDYASDDYAADDFGSSTASSESSAGDSGSTDDAPTRSDPNEPEPAIRGKAPPPAITLKPWWPAAKDQAGGALKILYAGSFKGSSANGIGVLFSEAVKADQNIGDFITVLDDSGKPVNPEWSLGNNPALARTGDLPRGRYLVQLKPGLESARGRKQALSLEGPVFVE